MSRTMFSRAAVLLTLAASAMAAPEPTTTAAIQSFLEVSNIDASQASDISTRFDRDQASYYREIATNPTVVSAMSVAATGMPNSAKVDAAGDPELYLASLAQASSDDLPDWFTALPTGVQRVFESMGDRDIEMYTSEVNVVRPLSKELVSSLSSRVKSITSSATSVITSKAAEASSKAAAASKAATQKGGAPASPLSSGRMGLVAGGVAIAAGLVGIALL
ncbi:MAG: hypothetical protein Q9168_006807 [Polycauliona sp. 1 TL-2023]